MEEVVVTFATYRRGRLVRREHVAQGVIKLGRDRHSHVWIDDDAAARLHAVVEVSPSGELALVDLGNEPATVVNGASVERSLLRIGDCIRIGATEVVLERVDVRRALVAAQARAVPAATQGGYAYTLLKTGPKVPLEEVELPHVLAAEVMVLWGENVLHVAHLSPPRSFYVGEQRPKAFANDFLIPFERLNTMRLPVVLGDASSVAVVIPPHATGEIERADRTRLGLDEARAQGEPCAEHPGARTYALAPGARARIELGEIVFLVAAVNAGKPVAHGLAGSMDWHVPLYFALSCLSVGGALSALALLVPPLGLSRDEGADDDRFYLMQQYLHAAAERENETEAAAALDRAAAEPEGTGTAAPGESGAMGDTAATASKGRYAVRGPSDNPEPKLARELSTRDAATFGVIGLLNSGAAGDPDAPTAPWGSDEALGRDALSARGSMWADQIGVAWGPAGLGPSGLGDGGGGLHPGIGMGPIATIDHGGGREPGSGPGWGNDSRRAGRGEHQTRVPSLRIGDMKLSGRLPGEVIQRVVRQNHGRFRQCYSEGLRKNPTLEGHVSVRFVIGRDGAVSNVSDGGSDLPDSSVVQCVVRAFYGLSFPPPEGGIVTVSYPLMLQPG